VPIDGFVDTETAARLLGVSARRVNQLADAGDITKASRGLYDRLSIERHAVARRGTSERAWESGTAWAAVAILSHRRHVIDWSPERSLYRLEAALRTITVPELVAKTRGRAIVHVLSGHSSVAKTLRDEVVVREWRGLGIGDANSDAVDGYVSSADLTALTERYALVAADSGTITLRATDFDMTTVRSLAKASDVLIALDAAGAIDTRVRDAGEFVLGRALDWVRERRGWTG
jgi:hypothetical protein